MTQLHKRNHSRVTTGYHRVQAVDVDAGSRPLAPYDLSPRELAVLAHMAEGLSDIQIALALGVTRFTVNKHVGSILIKMDVRSRTGAAVRAIRDRLVT